jgi:protein-tyrosine phosphatase
MQLWETMGYNWLLNKFKKKDKEVISPDFSILFVCHGNICRSPTAEGVFRVALDRAASRVACEAPPRALGTRFIGSPPDKRAIQAASRRGYDLTALRGRQVEPGDFARFGWILCMDESNLDALAEMRPPEFGGHLGLLLDFAPELGVREVPDPYFGAPAGFERVLDLIEASTAGLVRTPAAVARARPASR